MHTKLESIINSITQLSTSSFQKLQGAIEYQVLEKGDYVTRVNTHNNYEYFLLEGVCKSFLYTPNGDDVTISFFMENAVLSPHTTRIKEGKSIINIKALTAIKTARIHADTFEHLMINDLEIRNFGNTVLRNELTDKVQKEITLATFKGKEKLLYVRKKYPNIENRVPHADIASYLGLTNISLSRLRTQS